MFTGPVPQTHVQTTDRTFSDLGLSAEIVASLEDLGFEHPTPIQSEVITPALEGRDVIGLAETGSGKTAAFGLPMAERLRHGKGVRGLILCPTREIALQSKAFLDVLGRRHELDTACLIGGVAMGPQIDALNNRPDVIVATPGRLYDHVGRGNVRLDRVEQLVLDEGDHMLDMGFLPQILRILELLPDKRQTMLFSATMPPPIERLAQRFMRDPLRVDILPSHKTAEGIEHCLYLVEPSDMRGCLMSLVEERGGSTLIFLRRKVDAEWAFRQLEKEKHLVARIHSDRSQQQRVQALEGLRSGKHRILLATNIAARGIDIPIIEHIINFGVPDTVEEYVHRAGRTARGDAEGVVSTIASWQEKEALRMIERAIGQSLPRCTARGVEPYVERRTTIRGRKLRRRRML
ncbi:MAG: DEAD/DEAH box helicase [Acidobacteriota bacterium]|nr:DEAD/DEAH box helicase [Acidobacteriota bacterium]